MSARRGALSALMAVEQKGTYSTAAVQRAVKDFGLSGSDGGLCHQIVFGVLQNRLYLDFLIGSFSNVKPKKMESRVLQILRLSVYQLCFLERVPAYAVIDEAVSMTRKSAKNPKASGLVNAVLRRVEQEKNALPQPPDLSTKYSHPQELIDLWVAELGREKTEELLRANNRPAPVYAQANLLYTNVADLSEKLTAEGVACEQSGESLVLRQSGNLEQLSAFQKGLFYIQDPAARRAATLADAQPGMTVLDLCAAPGGKSFALALDMKNQGSVTSCDVYPHKIELIASGAKRLGLTCISPTLSDATVWNPDWQNRFDLVFADAPCSGLGIIRKRPEIRYKKLEDLQDLPSLQAKILDHAVAYAKPGGAIVYATCTLRRAENEQVVEALLAGRDDLALEHIETRYPCDGDWDGFFMAKLRKTK